MSAPILASASERSDDALTVATALALKDWQAIERMGDRVEFYQDAANPILPEAASFALSNAKELLGDCRFVFMTADTDAALRVMLAKEDGDQPLAEAMFGMFCAEYRMIEVKVAMQDDDFRVRFKKRGIMSDRRLEQLRRSGSNDRIVKGLVTKSLSDPDFEVGSAIGEARDGEPSNGELTAVALDYFAAIAEPEAAKTYPGLDLIDFGAMSWRDKESRKAKAITIEEIRERLEPCKLFEGRPKRYERDEERVMAFDSGWRCLSGQGPYSITVFLEMQDGAISGGRLIQKSSREDQPMPAAPAPAPAPAGAQ
ncbi:MAG: hypothetical protein AAF687_11160 [Pseudomonadota bacterium]